MAYVCIFILSVLFFTENSLGYEWFGCKYNDSNFNIRSGDPGEIQTIPDWGGQISTVQFTKKDFKEFIDKVNVMSKNILQDNNYNSLDDLLQFYNAFIQFKQNETNRLRTYDENYLEQFYRQYKMPNRLSGEEVGFIIKLVDEMAEKFEQVANKVFLSTCSSSVNLIDDFINDKLQNELPRNFNHDHVAGIIKISVDGSDGYVYLNPLMKFEDIVVMMNVKPNEELDKYLVKDTTSTYYTFRMDKSGQNNLPQYINFKYKSDNRDKYQFCYIAKPYCSFVETTVKPNIIRPRHLITAHGSSAQPEASLEVNLYVNQMGDDSYIRVWLPKNSRAAPGLQNIDLRFDKYSKNEETYEKLAHQLGFNETDMKDKIDTLYTLYTDGNFITNLKRIDKWYNMLHHSRNKQMTSTRSPVEEIHVASIRLGRPLEENL